MNARAPFPRNDWPTLGVELELQLVDDRTMALRSAYDEITSALPADVRAFVTPEFTQSCAEVITGVCRTVDDVETDLTGKLQALEQAAARQGVRLFWAGTHPFSHWRDQQITSDERYQRLAAVMQESLVRTATYGLHVHVGVESGETAIRVIRRLGKELPLLLALSANSPFWHGRPTGHRAHRIEVQRTLPFSGPPPRLHSWYEFTEIVDRLREAGLIEAPKDLWWDVRPSPRFGTVEVRICDMPPDLPSALALTAMVQCLVHRLAREEPDETEESPCESLMTDQNRWRASRYGLSARFVEPTSLEVIGARTTIGRLIDRLLPDAAQLGCEHWLERAHELAWRLSGSERQLRFFEESEDLADVVRRCTERSAVCYPTKGGRSFDVLRPTSPGLAGVPYDYAL